MPSTSRKRWPSKARPARTRSTRSCARRNIFRKAAVEPEQALAADIDYARHFADASGTEIWELWLLAGKTSFVVEQCIATTEPAFAAKHAFQLAQQFNNFYHRHHILTEADEERKKFLLATAAVVRRELIRVLASWGSLCRR